MILYALFGLFSSWAQKKNKTGASETRWASRPTSIPVDSSAIEAQQGTNDTQTHKDHVCTARIHLPRGGIRRLVAQSCPVAVRSILGFLNLPASPNQPASDTGTSAPIYLSNRSILLEHSVPYASNAKKGDLIDLFVDNVYSQRNKLLKKGKKETRSSGRGIVLVPTPSVASEQSVESESPVSRSTMSFCRGCGGAI